MTRNLKTLGLALVAALALSAVAASAASANPPKDARLTLDAEEGYTATITGTQTEAEDNEFVLPGNRSVECEKINYTGTYTEEEANEGRGSVTPEYENCHAEILGNITPMTITTNGCYSEFTYGNYISPTQASATTTKHLRCPEGHQIEIHVWQTESKHLNNEATVCTYGIPPQTIEGTVNFTISGAVGHPHTFLTITEEDLPIEVKRLSGTLTNCGAATQTGEITAKAKAEAKVEGEMVEATFSQVPE